MDRKSPYRFSFFAECRLFVKRSLLSRRRHKSCSSCQMASNDNKLDEGSTYPPSASRDLSLDHEGKLVRFEADVQNVDGIDQAPEKLSNGPENRPKKSLFEITSVVNTENENRGEGVGNEVDDSEFDDTLSETQEFTSPTAVRDQRLSSNSNGNEAPSAQTNATSRFKIVKIPRSARTEPHKRGRWTCQEYFDPPPESKIERNVSETRLNSSNHASSKVLSIQLQQGKESDFITSEARDKVNQGLQRKQSPSEQTFIVSNTEPSRYTTNVDASVSVNNEHESFRLNKNDDRSGAGASYFDQSKQSAVAATKTRNRPESKIDPRLPQTVEEALTQIEALQSNLVTVVETLKEVEQLKETMLNWTDENRQLKEENERLKKMLQKDDKQDPS